jgi:hypothetical protein
MSDNRAKNRALLRHLLLPTLFLTVALLGGVRVGAEGGAVRFLPPPLVTLVMAVMLMSLFVRGGAIRAGRWLSADNSPLANVSHALTLGALFFASAQAFNSVLPDAGLLRWMLSFFLLWTLWQNQFSYFDPRRLLRSLAALFGTAFFVKHVLLASLYAPGGGSGGWPAPPSKASRSARSKAPRRRPPPATYPSSRSPSTSAGCCSCRPRPTTRKKGRAASSCGRGPRTKPRGCCRIEDG